jgi:hypothetical protein
LVKLSDRQLLAGVGLLALAIVVTVATMLVAAIGRGGAPSVLRGEAIRVNSDLSPHTQLFGDTVTARIAIVVDVDQIALSSLRVDGKFGPYQKIGTPTVRRSQAGGTGYVVWTARLRCLDAACLSGKAGKRVLFPTARLSYSLMRGSDTARPARSVIVAWPALLAYSRLDRTQLAALDPRDEPPWRPDFTALPAVSYRASPPLLAFLFYGLGAVLIAACLALLVPPVLREVRRAMARSGPPSLRLPPYEQALWLLEKDVEDGEDVEARRKALELVAVELGQRGERDLELSARRLAWSPEPPASEDTRALAQSVRQVNGRRNGQPE